MTDIAIYKSPSGAIEVRLERETIWLTMAQIADLFGVNTPAISKHVKNIYACGELGETATVSKMETVRQEGKRRVRRSLEHYNLDMVISVGYRVNSSRATQFRIWATHVLKEHLTRGYTLNRQRFEQNARELDAALSLVRKAAAGEVLTTEQGRGLVEAAICKSYLQVRREGECQVRCVPVIPAPDRSRGRASAGIQYMCQ